MFLFCRMLHCLPLQVHFVSEHFFMAAHAVLFVSWHSHFSLNYLPKPPFTYDFKGSDRQCMVVELNM